MRNNHSTLNTIPAVEAYKALRLITDCLKKCTPDLDVEATSRLLLKNNIALSQLITTAFDDTDMSMTQELSLLMQVFGDTRTYAELDKENAKWYID
jgi:hypothetical protein